MNKFTKQFLLSIADAKKRLGHDDFRFMSWSQLWPSIGMGFEGIHGQALTTAQTVIILYSDIIMVYHGGRYAYMAPTQNYQIGAFIENQKFPGSKEALKNFGWK